MEGRLRCAAEAMSRLANSSVILSRRCEKTQKHWSLLTPQPIFLIASDGEGQCPMSPVNMVPKQSGRFCKGRSGNPKGRPKGSRNAATLACESLLDGQAEALTQTAIKMALAGDVVAMRLCLERICPPKKGSPVAFPLRPIYTARDAADALADVAAAVATGEITPSDADAISSVLGRTAKAFEIADAAGTKMIEQCSDQELYRIISRERTRHEAASIADAFR